MTSMKLALTGATGFIGSHVLTDLQEHGHDVTALVRNDSDADAVAARGATSLVVDLYDRPAVVRALSEADGAIHTASPGDETSADLDAAVVDAAIEAFAGTGKPYIHITGAWLYGENTHIKRAHLLGGFFFQKGVEGNAAFFGLFMVKRRHAMFDKPGEDVADTALPLREASMAPPLPLPEPP